MICRKRGYFMNENILSLILKISPQACEFVKDGFENNNTDILYYHEEEGVLLTVKFDDGIIFFASFINEINPSVYNLINLKTKEVINEYSGKEICFNVFGENQEIINQIRKIGFKVDMEGYHLEYKGLIPNDIENKNLVKKPYESSMAEVFADLFDKAYFQLNEENNWPQDSYKKNIDRFDKYLLHLNKEDKMESFWLDDELIGAYIIDDNYITDLVVNPKFQNRGYGTIILKNCLKKMFEKQLINIRLRVAKTNVGAKKLYERNKFVEISYFSENNYEKKVK